MSPIRISLTTDEGSARPLTAAYSLGAAMAFVMTPPCVYVDPGPPSCAFPFLVRTSTYDEARLQRCAFPTDEDQMPATVAREPRRRGGSDPRGGIVG